MEPDRRSRLEARIEAGDGSLSLLERICHESVAVLDVSTAALILMSRDESGTIAVSSHTGAAEVEDLQFSLGEGPCLEAYRRGEPVLEANLLSGESARWPDFVSAALAAHVQAVFALPLQLGAIRLGVLYLNRREPGGLTIEQLADASVLAEIATVALLSTQEGATSGELGSGLDGAWAHRAVVHQATGMISAQLGISIDEALARLRAHARTSSGDIYDTARGVVDGRLRIEP